MKTPRNTFTHAIAKMEPQIGLWMSLCSNMAADVIAPASYDWVLLDMEHSPNTLGSVHAQLQGFKGSGTVPLVRPEWNDPILVKRLLDLGVQGLIFPMIQTVEEAEAAVAATRYPPRGIRGSGGTNRANAFGRMKGYMSEVEDETTVILQIESQHALNIAEDIAAVDGVNGLFFGPADISADMGLLGQPMHDDVWGKIMPVAKALIAKGVPVGTIVLDPKFAKHLLDEGFTFVAVGMDISILANGADALLADVKGHIS